MEKNDHQYLTLILLLIYHCFFPGRQNKLIYIRTRDIDDHKHSWLSWDGRLAFRGHTWLYESNSCISLDTLEISLTTAGTALCTSCERHKPRLISKYKFNIKIQASFHALIIQHRINTRNSNSRDCLPSLFQDHSMDLYWI